MNSFFLKVYISILTFFVIELFVSGLGIVIISNQTLKSLLQHFSFSFEHYIELAFFHIFSIATLLFIVLHFLSIFRIKHNLMSVTLIGFSLLFGSHIVWYFFDMVVLKIVTSVTLFIFFLYLLAKLLKRTYLQTSFD